MLKKKFLTYFFPLFFISVSFAEKHVLFIGIDGARRDTFNLALSEIRQAQQDYFLMHTLIDDGALDNAIESGLDEGDKKQFTFSEPGWVSLLTGVWAYHHNIRFNGDIARSNYNHAYPTLYNYVKHFVPNATTASFTDWEPLSVLAEYTFYGKDAADINRYFSYEHDTELPAIDAKMTNEIIQLLQTAKPPTFIFVHYNNPDTAGHTYGFDSTVPEYLSALKDELTNVDHLLAAIPTNNEWLVVLTTDHGGHGISHGSLSTADREIFTVLHAAGTPYAGGILLPIKKGLVTFAPTILDFLSANHGYETLLDGDQLTPTQ